jgi:NIMA (never in mitosis gene a)-related kinase 2
MSSWAILASAFARTWVGTPFYMSPELANGGSYNTKSDVWALSCLIYEMCALEPPFQASSQPALTARILSGQVPPLPEEYSPELGRMVRFMLQTDADQRPSVPDLLGTRRMQRTLRGRKLQATHVELCRRELELQQRETA